MRVQPRQLVAGSQAACMQRRNEQQARAPAAADHAQQTFSAQASLLSRAESGLPATKNPPFRNLTAIPDGNFERKTAPRKI